MSPLVGGGDTKLYGSILERRIVSREFVEPHVMRSNEAELLQARIGEPPAAPLVDPHAMRDHARQRALGINQGRTLGLRVQHPFLAASLVGSGKA